jgi:hypothetical protein
MFTYLPTLFVEYNLLNESDRLNFFYLLLTSFESGKLYFIYGECTSRITSYGCPRYIIVPSGPLNVY